MRKKNIISIAFLILSFLITNAQVNKTTYLDSVKLELQKQWPANRTINIVFHGHSVPSGYADTPNVKSLDAYPHLIFHKLKEKYPYAVINVITTGIGGENSVQGAKRFEDDVLNHKPDVLFIDYSLNDRSLSLDEAKKAWSEMIEKALAKGIKVILLTPTLDKRSNINDDNDPLCQHAAQVRGLVKKYKIGLVDSFSLFCDYINNGGNIEDIMVWINHPNRKGHEIVANEIIKWF